MVSSGVYPFLDHLARWAFLPDFYIYQGSSKWQLVS